MPDEFKARADDPTFRALTRAAAPVRESRRGGRRPAQRQKSFSSKPKSPVGTGARDGAIASLKLKHVDIDQSRIDQDARQVTTKFSKSFTTEFFPVGSEVEQIVREWFHYLRQEKLWGLDDPLFPATKIVVGDTCHFEVSGLDGKHWSSAGPIRAILRDAIAAAGVPYFNPHSFRKTLVLLGARLCKSPKEYKAWSQNLGHENVLTTFSSYGDVAEHRQAEIIRSFRDSTRHEGRSLT